MEERIGKLETRIDELTAGVADVREGLTEVGTGLEDVREGMSEVRTEISVLSERVYGVEDRLDAASRRFDVGFESLRGDLRLTFERIAGLQHHMERSFEDFRKERAAEREDLQALVRDHNRRLRAIERLENRRRVRSDN